MGRRLRTGAGLLALVELVVFVLVALWIGVGWTILATLATSALGAALLTKQGTRALADLRERARTRRPAGRELGDAGLIGAGGLLMLLPGFVGDLVGLLCLLPGTRRLVRAVLLRILAGRLPGVARRPVKVRSARVEQVDGEVRVDVVERVDGVAGADGEVWRPGRPAVIEGEVVGGPTTG